MQWYEVLGLLGIGAILSTVISFILDRINKKSILREENLILMKIERYRSLLVFMNLVLKPSDIRFVVLDDNKPMIEKGVMKEEEIKKLNLEKIKGYYYHLFLFASKEVIKNVEFFISEPTQEKFINTSTAMRKDIWNTKV